LISAGALPQTPLGELTAYRPLAVFKGLLLSEGRGKAKGKGRGGKGKRVGKEKGGEGYPPIGESGSASGKVSVTSHVGADVHLSYTSCSRRHDTWLHRR